MLSKRTGQILEVCTYAAFGLIAISFAFDPNYKVCQYSEAAKHEYCSSYSVVLFLLIKVGDVINYYGVAITALATIVVARFTRTIYLVNQSQLRLGHQIERAYVAGGIMIEFELDYAFTIPPNAVVLDADDGLMSVQRKKIEKPRWVVITVSNHGKTPAFVSAISVVPCAANELPSVPEYDSAKRDVEIRLSPMTIDAPTVLKYEVQETRGKIIYGRVYYTDIFRANRSSGFIMRIGSAGAVPFEAAAEYTAWD